MKRLALFAFLLCSLSLTSEAATVVKLGTGSVTTTSGTKAVTPASPGGDPQVGDLIVLVTVHTGNTSNAAPTDNNSSGTYVEITGAACVKASSADQMRIWVRTSLITTSTSTTYTHAPGTTTGGGLFIFAITGVTRTGSSAIVKAAKQDNQSSGGTPTPVFSSAPSTGNPILGAVFNASNPATMTPRSSPAWTEQTDLGYNSPTTGLETASINSGETATSIAWGSTSGSAFCAAVVEIDTSAAPSGTIFRNRTGSRMRRGSP